MSADESDKMAVMDRWLGEVCVELGVDRSVLDANTVAMLALIKSVAHGPSRPGAPMTAFLIGLAAGAAAPTPAAQTTGVADNIGKVNHLISTWTPDPLPTP
ncbi:DUF6457 domain-containing protein [Pengzhenrongella phosphoraccumulans]|uniref:DUF6457 domain-containing protein n=1 Tax=Pengzhenrongella phosphoraccumulans TaxID=3114394 RepID=UPI00388F7827